MPDVLSHIICGEEAVEKISREKYRRYILERQKLFNLGTQGPDIFFYHDIMSLLRRRKDRKGLGELMHTRETGRFLLEGVKYLDNQEGDRFKDLFVYLSGFMCHFGLDRIAHPYIFYFGGVYNEEYPDTEIYLAYHKKLEIAIDSRLLKEKRGMEANDYPVYREIDLGIEIPEVIIDFYNYAFETIYEEQVFRDLVNDSYNDMKQGLKLLYDPHGIKDWILKALGRLSARAKYINCAMYSQRISGNYDVMNSGHILWSHPCDENENYDLSFYELLNRAINESREMINASIEFLGGRQKSEFLKDFFPNVSYVSGKTEDYTNKLRYYKPIFERP